MSADIITSGPFDELPPELVSIIFSFVPLAQVLGRLMRVCRRFYSQLKAEQYLWLQLCLVHWKTNNFEKVNLQRVIAELQHYDPSKDWIWVAACLSREDAESGLSWRKFTTISGRSLVSIGEVKNNRLCSVGLELYLDASTFYLGKFNEGKLHGKGAIFWEGGSKYEGDWKEGHREGFGSYTWTNGDRYVGEFKNDGKKEGRGTFFYADGDRFEGHYKNDEREGWGRMVWKGSNFIYEGNFVNNEPEDLEQCLHPALQEVINKDLCTGTITERSLDFGQQVYGYECAEYCTVCWKSCTPPPTKLNSEPKVTRKWADGVYCACVDRDVCQKRKLVQISGPPLNKKQKVSN